MISSGEPLRIDKDGFIYKDGLKICQAAQNKELVFLDKNKMRAQIRGGELVRISLEDLIKLLLDFYKINRPA